MKKIFYVLLCLTLVFSMVPSEMIGAYSSQSDNQTSAIEILDALEILPDDFNINAKISRGSFVELLISAMGLDGINYQKPLPFNDVSETDKIYSAVCTAYDLGIINGNGSGFMPKATLNYNQAIKMVVSALGYGDVAMAKGGYPVGYIAIANSMHLSDGLNVSGDDALKGSDAVVMVYNALNSPVLQVASIGGNSVSYSDSDGKTFLNVYHGIERIEGRLSASSGNVLSGDYELDKNQIIIDGITYKTADINCDSLVGFSVYAYYKNSEATVVAIEKNPYSNNAVIVSADDFISFKDGWLYYEDSEKEKKIKVEPTSDISYNGRPAKSANYELFDLDDGEMHFIDSDSDGEYESIVISDFENYVVSAVDPAKKIISDLYTPGKVLEIGDTDEIFIDDFGNTMYYEELKKYDVISVWQSTDGKNIKMRYSNKEIKGAISEKGNGYFVIDGDKIKISKSFEAIAETVKLGSKGIFCLDASGKIAAFKESDDTDDLAYLIQAGAMGSSLNQNFMIRIFTHNGDILVLNCDVEKLKIDGASKTPVEAKEYLSKSQIIRYRTNLNGDVVMIDTAKSGSGDDDKITMLHSAYDSDYKSVDSKRLRYSRGGNLYSGKVAVDASTPIFNVPHPDTVENDNNYYITYSNTTYTSATYVSFEAYTSKENSFFADALVIYNLSGGGASIPSKTPVTVVDEITEVIDSNGEYVYKLSCYYDGGNYREYIFEDEEMLRAIKDADGNPHTLKKGDIVRLNVNSNSGVIKRVDLVYDREDDMLTKGAVVGTDEYFVSERFVKGFVYEKEDGYISLTQEDVSGINGELTLDQKEIYRTYSSKILVYDSENRNGTLSKGSISDILDFKSFGIACSKAVIFNVDGGDNCIVVIYK
ncbi:MAG: S-layer homology domain-containing protein [Clostridia bacterium]|nr:S-layer homology domain-containing protein [Clostridia bacterium]